MDFAVVEPEIILLESGEKKYFLSGPMSQADVRNGNGRIYPKDVLREAVLDLKKRVEQIPHVVYSYKEHPNHFDLIREDSAGVLKEVTWDEDTGISYCKLEVFNDTISGKKLIEEIEQKIPVGISTRGVGKLDENKVVQPGLRFVTSDAVATPSCQMCNLSLNESVNSTITDFLIEEETTKEDCGCIYENLNPFEQMELQRKTIEHFKKLFKGTSNV